MTRPLNFTHWPGSLSDLTGFRVSFLRLTNGFRSDHRIPNTFPRHPRRELPRLIINGIQSLVSFFFFCFSESMPGKTPKMNCVRVRACTIEPDLL